MRAGYTAFIGLGGNLGATEVTLRHAVAALRELPDTDVTGLSRLYRSIAIGPDGQPDYHNAVVRLQTLLPPHALLSAMQTIENAHGRIREQRWGARTLDLDMLLYAHDIIDTPELRLPHPEITARNFVVQPLLDIEPALCLPDGRPLAALAAATDPAGLSVVAATDWAD